MKFFEYKAEKVWFTDNEIKVLLNDGRESALPISDFSLLKNASNLQRQNVEIVNGYALYWPDLGEDLSIAGFLEEVAMKHDRSNWEVNTKKARNLSRARITTSNFLYRLRYKFRSP